MSKWKRKCSEILSEDFIREYKDKVNWEKICRNTVNKAESFPYGFVREFEDKIRWDILTKVPHDERFWDEFGDKYSPEQWAHIIEEPTLFSEDLLLKYVNKYYNWKIISVFRKLDEKFMDKYAEYLDWGALSLHQNMSSEFIEKYRFHINIHNLLFWKQAGFNQSQLREFVFAGNTDEDKDNQSNACKQKGIWDLDFIREQQDKINWDLLVLHNKDFPPEFFYEFGNKLPTDLLEGTQNMPEQFIERYKERWNWFNIFTCQKLSEQFIRKHIDEFKQIRSDILFRRQNFSEAFIEELINILGEETVKEQHVWSIISRYQKLSESFIEKHAEEVDWLDILTNQEVSDEFRKKWGNKLKVSDALRYKNWLESKINLLKLEGK